MRHLEIIESDAVMVHWLLSQVEGVPRRVLDKERELTPPYIFRIGDFKLTDTQIAQSRLKPGGIIE